MSGVSTMPLILTPFGAYGAKLNAIEAAHDAAVKSIQEAAAVLSNNLEQWEARVEIERKAAWDEYQAALRASN